MAELCRVILTSSVGWVCQQERLFQGTADKACLDLWDFCLVPVRMAAGDTVHGHLDSFVGHSGDPCQDTELKTSSPRSGPSLQVPWRVTWQSFILQSYTLRKGSTQWYRAPFTRTCCTRIKMRQLSVTVLGIDKATLGTSSAPLFHHPFSYLGRLLLDHSMGLIWHGMDTNLFELSSRGDRNREIMTGTSESVFVPVARVSWCL